MPMTLTFRPGAALVVGGSGGIGAGICRRFCAAGVPVYFSYHGNEARAGLLRDELEAGGGECDYLQVDLSNPRSVADFVQSARSRFEHVAHVVYAAGPKLEFRFIGSIPDPEWQDVVNTDINGAFYLIQNAVQCFRDQGEGGNLVAVITSAVERVPLRDCMSAAPKAAIEMLIRGVAKESGRFGIRANCVAPGWVNAGLGKIGLEEKLDEQTREHLRKTAIPLQRFGEAGDIGDATVFLCSRQADYISGQSLMVDGGLHI